MAVSDYHDILVVVKVHRGKVAKPSLEILTKARELADGLGARVDALVLGDDAGDVGESVIHHGADTVLVGVHASLVTGNVDAYYHAILPIVKERKPEIVLVSATPMGLDLAPRLGAALGTGALSDATKLEIDETDRLLVAKRLTYDGSVEAVATIPRHRPQIASLRPGAVRVGYPDDMRYGRVERLEVAIPRAADKVRLVAMEDAPPAEAPLESAEIVVTGGLGLSKEDFSLVHDLARALGATWGASRAAVQFGLAPASRQVGATGAHVAPKLYVACGVSGQFEHFYGIRRSDVVVGINPEKDAPLFRFANYGLVGDAKEIVPRILDQLRKD